ncbi:HXXEE domain-containing protein [Pseudorhodoplanes sp.]|uniref:HXXEE domain-containing protein n=1 Tax=Pseudorhodoplanes sp. TaxID=1934341 RepID=UPI002C14A41D|nr:HXXEE domain-containing protein [Pseudorhodoplanes sp.]HWV53476.1 HXXEE domain-containing protein [Pseudorhodoplanes sp.]
MHPLNLISADWQKALPVLIAIGIVVWLILFRNTPTTEQALFAAALIIYMIHQIEEHLWPGGFRQFANARLFKSGNDDWPVTEGGVALVNVGYVWLPILFAALFPGPLRWLGLAWIGGTLVNALTHIIGALRLRSYNPGLVTSIVLFLPFTIWALSREVSAGLLTGWQVVGLLIAGVLLHIPVAALFVLPYRRGEARA